ncbi:hypothetical protein Skr01_06890 [Sphaerisporangium krabiense]|uniref:Protein-L-isoaspartate O-methyltransferase n=1 Tax=Sphaerisporangium krabiense TaxID=763782 RepID=A0A7W8ZDE1_9ACTN|nr:methyltransferase domain-containing protein [Sphaerisporangium krabiense]MBB5631760.1 protein-L-isoaspartate(D-aspartate) O-methyltransferase [Sphaerisporangium krabiense]GII60604.1 hypothetical protein Skr01_06890 [Sphaerisporangium krabiense]
MASATTPSPPVQDALNRVTNAHYTQQADGSTLPQTSAPEIVATMLDLLQVQPGQHVREIGTGSGYSTALLSHLVGSTGTVTSIDIDPELTRRARQRLDADECANVTLIAGDGAAEAPGPHADRIIAWATMQHIPTAWTRHAAPGALIVTPVEVTDAAKTFLVIRGRRGDHDQALTADRLLHAGFVEAVPDVLDQWIVPPRGVDALTRDDEDQPWWLSAPWLRSSADGTGDDLLNRLITHQRHGEGPLTNHERAADFWAYLLAGRPDGLTTAALGEPLWRIGASTPTGVALITPSQADHHIAAGDDSATDLLNTWARQWREGGEPGLDQMRPVLHPAHDGWIVRVAPQGEEND